MSSEAAPTGTVLGTGTGSTVRAVTQDRYGHSDVLRVAVVPRPAVGTDQVLLRVHAAGLDRGTEHLMTGKPYAMRLASGSDDPGTRCWAATSPALSYRSARP
jgi:hypothetical protein